MPTGLKPDSDSAKLQHALTDSAISLMDKKIKKRSEAKDTAAQVALANKHPELLAGGTPPRIKILHSWRKARVV